MNAMISYLLTEQGQRANLLATGQPVPRKHTVTIDIPNDQAALLQVREDGVPFLDLTGPYPGPRYGESHWRDLLAMTPIPDGNQSNLFAGFDIPDPDIAARIGTAAADIHAAAQYDIDYPASLLAADTRLADWVLTSPGPQSNYGPELFRRAIEACGLKPNDSRLYNNNYLDKVAPPKLKAAAAAYLKTEQERETAARQARAAESERITAEIARIKAEKESREAEKEAAKLEYIAAWIAEHGSESQKARSADGLLCRDEGILALADATFGAVNGRVYTIASRPLCDCSNEQCSSEECEVELSVVDNVVCLTEGEYARLTSIKDSIAEAKFVLRTHSAVHDCSHGDCGAGVNRGVMIKKQVGPLWLQREYVL